MPNVTNRRGQGCVSAITIGTKWQELGPACNSVIYRFAGRIINCFLSGPPGADRTKTSRESWEFRYFVLDLLLGCVDLSLAVKDVVEPEGH